MIDDFAVENGRSMSMPQFDPALGTLTGATVALTGGFTLAVNFVTTPPPATVTFAPPITLSGLQTGVTLPTQTVAVPADGFVVGSPGSIDLSGALVAALSTLTGTGFSVDGVTGNAGSTRGGPANVTDVSSLTGQVTYTFTYTPAGGAVPEPASLARLGAGVLGLGLARCRGRSPISA